MRSLTAHLRDTDSHDRLPFHPSCPICRQRRLSGTLASGGVVAPRTQALLAASVLAVTATAPVTVAFAAEQDRQQEGNAPAAGSAPPDAAASPDFDPGGEATDLPGAAAPTPQTQTSADADDDAGPVEQAPIVNPDDPVVDQGDGSDPTAGGSPPAPESVTPADAPAPSQPMPPASPPGDGAPAPTPTTDPAPPAAATAPVAAPGAETGAESRDRRAARERIGGHHPKPVSAKPAPQAVPATPTVAPAPRIVAAPPTASAQDGRRARPGDRAHTVLAGESLWSIATDLLESDAAPARVVREVHRLWQLNRERIGTGDPDLLLVGTRLELR
jgi:hypothetical protein